MKTDRYIRQIISDPGFQQEKLTQAVVLVVGLGGLGSAASMYLAASGVGNLILCDYDTISISNLNRQLLYSETQIGQRKVEIATGTLNKINSGTTYTQLDEKFSRETVISSPKPQLILDCLDNFQSRVDLAGFAFKNNIPLVHAAIHGFMGQMTFFWPGISACPACIAPDNMNQDNMNQDNMNQDNMHQGNMHQGNMHQGNMHQDNTPTPAVGACAGVIGSMQALEVIKYFTGLGKLYTNRFMLFNGLSGCFEEIVVEMDPHCRVCGD